MLGELYGEETLVHGLSKTVDDTPSVEVEARRCVVIEGVEACSLGEGILAKCKGVPSKSLEERVPGGDPLEVVRLRGRAIRR